MVRCPKCGKELKSTQALSGHRALAHRSASARGAESSAPGNGAVSTRALADLCSELLAAVDERLEPVLAMVRALSAECSTVSTEPAPGEPVEPGPEPESKPATVGATEGSDPYLAGLP